ncbi:MAG: hypothetical protein KDH20_15100 [Rhodocyclaceae bacterium]|nr:hypothetical protein [Rhodocyclaceae bacterium]
MAAERPLGRLLTALALSAGLLFAPPLVAGDEISEAEQVVFMQPHLDNVAGDRDLHYAFHREETEQPALDDTVTLFVRADGERGRVVTAEFLHGEHALTLPEVTHATANPVVLYFLERDVRDMHRRLGGKEHYFRKRIRMALANEATVEAVRFEYDGQTRSGTRVTVQPYAGDPNVHRFQGLDNKRYEFTFSDDVPGGIFELGTVVTGDKTRKVPEIREALTLSPDKG